MSNALMSMLVSVPQAGAQTQSDSQSHDGMMQRGDHVMGFSHDKTTHHFELFKDGGEIRGDSVKAGLPRMRK
jgi:hypothetical protein